MARDASAIPISVALVEYLREKGHTLRDIGEIVGLSESFISRVANGHRSFTVDHLEVFERRLGQPLSALLLDAKWGNSIPADKRQQFEEVLAMLRDLGNLRAELGSATAEESQEPAIANKRAGSSSRRAAG